MNAVWTDGGNAANFGYFSGVGRFNDLLMCMFAGKDCDSNKYPFANSIMGSISYDTKVKITVIIETID